MSNKVDKSGESPRIAVQNKIQLISGAVFGVGIVLLIGMSLFKGNHSAGSGNAPASAVQGSEARFRAQGDLSSADAGGARQTKRSGDARSEVVLSKDETLSRQVTEANKLMSQGKYEESYAVYKKILDDNPKNEDAHFNMGILLGKMKKYPEAIQHYEEALKIMPDYTEAHNNLGNVLVSLGKFDDGIVHFKEALRLFPEHAAANNNLGNALARQGKTMQATDYFLKALKLKPDYVEAHFNLASAYFSLNRPEDAIKEYEEVLLLRPGFEPAMKALEKLKFKQPSN